VSFTDGGFLIPLGEPGGTMHTGLGSEGAHRCGFPDAAKSTRVTCPDGRAKVNNG